MNPETGGKLRSFECLRREAAEMRIAAVVEAGDYIAKPALVPGFQVLKCGLSQDVNGQGQARP